jgi:two-component system nitrogen regulation response regulator NtrX
LCRELRRDGRAQIRVPPLRRRSEDIPIIIEETIARCSARSGAAMKTFTHPAMTVMAALPWMGNVAELRDIVERLLATTRGGVIQLEDVLSHVRLESTSAPRPEPGEIIPPGATLRVAREQFERDYIGLAIRQHQGRISQAARALGLQRTNLYRKARQLGMALK